MEEPRILGDRRRKFMYQLLRAWQEAHGSYENELKHDVPYAYGERTNIGVLALAAMSIGGYPLEEYTTEKGHKASKKFGRGDLWIQDRNGNGWDFETKHHWRSFIRPRRLTDSMCKCVDVAFDDVEAHTYKSDYQVGLVFLAPYIHSKTAVEFSQDFLKEHIGSFKRRLQDIHNELESRYEEWSHFVAAHLCTHKTLNNTGSGSVYGGYDYFPGIVAICRIA